MNGLLANENIPLEAVRLLRADGIDIISATESYRGKDDIVLLNESNRLEKVLITFDKDFGDLVFYHKSIVPYGVILLRFKPKSAEHIYTFVSMLLKKIPDFSGGFSVVTEKKVRMIPFEKRTQKD